MKWTKNLLSGVILCLNFSCAQQSPQPTFCPIAVHADDCVKEWLDQQEPPACVNDYLYKIGVQESDIDKYCH